MESYSTPWLGTECRPEGTTVATNVKILLVEDDAKLAGLVREFLSANGFVVTHEPRGDRAPARII